MKSLSELGEFDRQQRGYEFAKLIKYYAAARGSVPNAALLAEQQRAPKRVQEVLRAAVGAGSISIGGSPSIWGEELVGYKPMVEGFFQTLRSRSIFFRLLGENAFARVPMRTRLAFAVSNVSGYIVGAGKPKPLSKLDLSNANFDPIKAAAQVVVTEELVRDAGPAAEVAFGRELRGAVADTVDAELFDLIGQSISPISATANPLDDLENLLDDVNTTGSGALFWCMRPTLANAMSAHLATDGNRMFSEMTPLGGQILGLPALVSTQVAPTGGSPGEDALWLLDASGIVADSAEIEVRMSRESVIEMDDAPSGDAVTAEGLGATSLVSLWQENLVAILAEVRFSAYKYRSNAVAVLEGVAW